MSEAGDFELFSASAAQEKSEAGDEVFSDQMRRVQQQLKQLQQEEQKHRGYDQNLAAIIVQFLSQPGNTDLFLLISRGVAANIPSELILAIIALVDEKALEAVYALLRGGKTEVPGTALAVREPHDLKTLPPEHKTVIDEWIKNLHHVSLKTPHRVLQSLVLDNHNHRQITPAIPQLSAFILRRYMEKFQLPFDFDHLHDFMQTVFVEIVKKLEALVQNQKQLKTSEQAAA